MTTTHQTPCSADSQLEHTGSQGTGWGEARGPGWELRDGGVSWRFERVTVLGVKEGDKGKGGARRGAGWRGGGEGGGEVVEGGGERGGGDGGRDDGGGRGRGSKVEEVTEETEVKDEV